MLVAVGGFFVVMSIWGFFWMCWKLAKHNYEFFTALDISSPSGAAVACGSALSALAALYYIFYPEGQLACVVQSRSGSLSRWCHIFALSAHPHVAITDRHPSLRRDAVRQYGEGRVTFAYGESKDPRHRG